MISCLFRRRTNFQSFKHFRPLIFKTAERKSFRTFGTSGGNTAFFFAAPKITFFRLILTGGATTFGFLTYKLNSFSDWLRDSIESLGLLEGSVLSGVFGDLMKTKKSPGIILDNNEEEQLVVDDGSNNYFKSDKSDEFNDFIRKMIQIKEILRMSGNEDTINLPSIVVIGGQSSGKSSVLESIVSREFLPKGQNMVTRRPLEMTLVHSPHETEDSVIISQYDRNLKIKDFSKVQEILNDLNAAVPEDEWISFEPIRMTIYSKNVPDLTLVDLPGYIQVTNKAQPPILRDKIRGLCDKYIKSNNLILAVCAADVDLANSEALKASRKYDPKGERTIGVITKLDLVDPKHAASLVVNEDYPLNLGYIGVVCKSSTGSSTSSSAAAAMAAAEQSQSSSILSKITGGKFFRDEEDPKLAFERAFFSQNQEVFSNVRDRLGLMALRRLLTASLEEIMSNSLGNVVKKVSDDLEDLRYQLKAQYSDRFVSPEAYVSDLISSLKNDFSHLSRKYTRNEIDSTLRRTFNQKLIQNCDESIWKSSEAEDKEKMLKSCLNSFTRSGVGKFTANLVSEAILTDIQGILKRAPFTFHSELGSKILQAAETFLKKKCQAAMDQVENSMKPFKQKIEFTPKDWNEAQNRLLHLLETEKQRIKSDIEVTKREIGSKRLKRAVEYLHQNAGSVNLKENPVLLKADEVVSKTALLKRLEKRKMELKKGSKMELASVADWKHRTALWTRLSSLFSHDQRSDMDGSLVYEPPLPTNSASSFSIFSFPSASSKEITIFKDPCQTEFPEIYLYMVMDRFLRTCSTFVHYELVSEFLQPFPDDVISADPVALDGQGGILSLTKMSAEQLKALLKENPEIAAHLAVQEKYKALEEALRNLKQMKQK